MQLRWPKWLAFDSWSSLLKTAVVWLKRATGIGYRKYQPLIDEGHVDPFIASRLEAHAKAMVREVEDLDRELRRSGLGNPRQR